jgi:hypothetical protein
VAIPTTSPSAVRTGAAPKPWDTSSSAALLTVVCGRTEITGRVITSRTFMIYSSHFRSRSETNRSIPWTDNGGRAVGAMDECLAGRTEQQPGHTA